MGQTAHEYARALAASMDALGSRNRTVGWFVGPLSLGIAALTDLYMQSLFGPAALNYRDSRSAIRVWLDIRWRLGLINIVLTLYQA
jgi:hypothetical protein